MEQLRDPLWMQRARAEGYMPGEGSGAEMDFCPRMPGWLSTRYGRGREENIQLQGGKSMGRHFVSYEAQCPFYKAEDKNIIYCEGVEESSSIHNAFPGSAAKYKARYCCADWESCLIAKMLWSKYD